jgi:hypothetical protein
LHELVSSYNNGRNLAVSTQNEIAQVVDNQDLIVSQQETGSAANESILAAIECVEQNIMKLDDLLLSQFGAISKQISDNIHPLSTNIKREFSELGLKLEHEMMNYMSSTISPFLGKISGAEDKVSEILKTMSNVEEVALLKREKNELKEENIKLVEKNKELNANYQEAQKLVDLEKQDFEKVNKDSIAKIADLNSTIEKLRTQIEECKSNDNSDSGYIGKLLDQLDKDSLNISPINCLRHIENIHGSKVHVLLSARDSAKAAADFDNGLQLLLLLNRLIVKYLPVYLESGDNKANEIFPKDTFASKESESTMKNYKDTRKFDYDGKRVLMEHHLKFGVATNKRLTLRVHFLPDRDKNRIVIGYCGAHLPI